MNCVKTSDSGLDIDANNSPQNHDSAADWYESFKSSTKLAENEAAKTSLQQPNQLVHDICTKDVKAFSMTSKTIYATVPCNQGESAGCRGGFLPNVAPTVANIRILCADERLSPSTGCDHIIIAVEF